MDLDGTLYLSGRVFPGTLPLLSHIRETGGRTIYVTNNSSLGASDYAARFRAMGLPGAEEDFFTATEATAQFLLETYPGRLVFCVGTDSLVSALRGRGIPVVTEYDAAAEIVLVGCDMELRYQKLIDASRLLEQGDPVYLATNPDWACPTSFGFVPDCGAICKTLEYATGKWPRFLGKPDPAMILAACRRAGVPPAEAVVLGDRLYTDIAAGRNAGVDTVCVLTGEATAESVLQSDVRPDYTFPSVSELLACLRE